MKHITIIDNSTGKPVECSTVEHESPSRTPSLVKVKIRRAAIGTQRYTQRVMGHVAANAIKRRFRGGLQALAADIVLQAFKEAVRKK